MIWLLAYLLAGVLFGELILKVGGIVSPATRPSHRAMAYFMAVMGWPVCVSYIFYCALTGVAKRNRKT